MNVGVQADEADLANAVLTFLMHMQLTGVLPFEPSPTDKKPVAPDWVLEEHKEDWEEYEAILQLHCTWVRPTQLTKLVMFSLHCCC